MYLIRTEFQFFHARCSRLINVYLFDTLPPEKSDFFFLESDNPGNIGEFCSILEVAAPYLLPGELSCLMQVGFRDSSRVWRLY